jgi:hypothetical protein
MDSVRILYTHEPGHGWFFTSPDLAGLVGGDVTYAAAHARAEDTVRSYLSAEAQERGEQPHAVEIVHFVPDTLVPPIAA